ncbi:hypothetical protein ACFL1Y_00570 [Patescibacteria group bacterium]
MFDLKDQKKESKDLLSEKKQDSQEILDSIEKKEKIDAKIYTMPKKFLSNSDKVQKNIGGGRSKSNTGFKKNIIIGVVVAVVVLVFLSLAGWFLIKSIENPQEVAKIDLVENSNKQENEPEETEDPNKNIDEVCSAENCDLCTAVECTELSEFCHLEDSCYYEDTKFGNDNSNCPIYICLQGSIDITPEEENEFVRIPLARDSDFDLLTDTEEGLWGSNPLNLDTDGDGYNDGEEVKYLYNPNSQEADKIKLTDTELVESFSNSEYGFSVYYPKSWTVNDIGDQVTFSSLTDEFIQVIVQENYSGFLTAKDWYLTQNTSINEEALEEFLIGNWSGIKSPDGLNVYLVYNNYIYTLAMNIGLKTELNYQTTFEMMINSFRLFEAPL